MALNGPFKSIKINKMLKGMPDPQAARMELDSFYNSTSGVSGVKANSKFVIAESDIFHAMLSDNVVLVYILRKGALDGGIVARIAPTFVSIMTADGKDHLVSTRKADKAIELIDYLFPLLPNAAFGYSVSTDEAFRKHKKDNFQALREIARKQHISDTYKEANPYAMADADASVFARVPNPQSQTISGKYFNTTL